MALADNNYTLKVQSDGRESSSEFESMAAAWRALGDFINRFKTQGFEIDAVSIVPPAGSAENEFSLRVSDGIELPPFF
jgi:hypothetical protein